MAKQFNIIRNSDGKVVETIPANNAIARETIAQYAREENQQFSYGPAYAEKDLPPEFAKHPDKEKFIALS